MNLGTPFFLGKMFGLRDSLSSAAVTHYSEWTQARSHNNAQVCIHEVFRPRVKPYRSL